LATDHGRAIGEELTNLLVDEFGEKPTADSEETMTSTGIRLELVIPNRAAMENVLSLAIDTLLSTTETHQSGELAASERGRVVEETEKNEKEFRSSIRKAISKDGGYERIVSVAKSLRTILQEEIAAAIQAPINEKLRASSQDSYAEKQAISSWVNSELRDLGLAVKCPKTGRPANLVADLKQAGSDVSRFRLEVRGDDGKRTRTIAVRTLPDLEVIEDEPRQEPILEWSHRVKSRRSDKPGKGRPG